MANNNSGYVSPFYNLSGGSQRQCSVCLQVAQNGQYFYCSLCPEYCYCFKCSSLGGGTNPHHHHLTPSSSYQPPRATNFQVMQPPTAPVYYHVQAAPPPQPLQNNNGPIMGNLVTMSNSPQHQIMNKGYFPNLPAVSATNPIPSSESSLTQTAGNGNERPWRETIANRSIMRRYDNKSRASPIPEPPASSMPWRFSHLPRQNAASEKPKSEQHENRSVFSLN